MRTRHFLSCLNWLCVFVLMAEELSAQALFEERHIPYTSDSLWVYKLPYISVGDSGLHCIWDFSTIWTDSVEVVEADYFAAH